VAKALGATATAGLLGEVNASAPERSKRSDGAIGDPAHGARASDHNPCGCCRVVCARDFTHDPAGGFDSYAFAEWLRARCAAGLELRVKYLISDGKIASGVGQSHAAGVWRPYTGKNRHAQHVHVSVRHGAELFDDDTPWGWPPPPPAPSAERRTTMEKRREDDIPPGMPPDDDDEVREPAHEPPGDDEPDDDREPPTR
jgi:hypothetical protein